MPSQKNAINTENAPKPVGPYNQAIVVGELVFCSGQIALDPMTGLMIGKGDVEKETSQVLKNLLAVLNEINLDVSNIVKTTIFLVDLKDFEKVNRIYSDIFNDSVSPARACVEVSGLPKKAKIEIDCIAYKH
tara:strand:- start:7407 stop:7802 length:396 start_codon:yes stop_codon:yes gene_type:complete